MSFTLRCPHKNCRKDSTPELNTTTKQVLCSECHQEIENITSFQKEIMKASGQILKNNYQHEAFSVDCKKCHRIIKPIRTVDDKIVCQHCFQELTHLSKVYCHMLKQNLPKTQIN